MASTGIGITNNKMIKKGKRKLSLIDKIILALNIIAAITLLLSYLAPVTDPRTFALIALLGFAYQPLFIVNVLFIIYWLIRSRILALISAVSLLSGVTVFALNFGFHFFSHANVETKPQEAIRMMEYNVHGFVGIQENDKKPILDSIARVISINKPDIINIEEVYLKKRDSAKRINTLQAALGFKYFYYKPFINNQWFSSGNAIFSRFPIIDTGYVQTANILDTKAIYIDVKYKNETFRVYCIHLAAVEIKEVEKRKFMGGHVNLGILSFIQGRLISAFLLRNHQVDKIKEDISKCPYPYIVAGDFNDTPISYAVNEMSDGLKNAFIEKGSGFGTSYYSLFPKLHLDYILVSPQFDVLSYQTVNKKLSDHRPIFSDLRLNK